VGDAFDSGSEPRAEAAQLEGNEMEIRRLRPLLERERKRWIAMNVRVTRANEWGSP